MLKKLIPILILILTSCAADNATTPTAFTGNFSGKWRATKVVDTLNDKTNTCTDFEFEITQTDKILSIAERKFNCDGGGYTMASSSVTVDVDGTKLSFLGTEAGDLSDNFIHFNVTLNGGSLWILSIDYENDSFRFLETVTGLYTATATLTR